MTACIIGWAHTAFGRLEGETVESLIVRAATAALDDAGVAARDIDEILLGHFNAGFSAQDFTAALVLQASSDLRFKRATRVENACATGSAAVHQGLRAIDAGAARLVLVVGVEQMTTTPPAESAPTCSRRPMYVRKPTLPAASQAFSARSPASISRNTAISPMRWH
jgi:acetyl-CoA C-acetyltransferase